ncbi:MAG: zf-HC2 domain-containing protein [Clostridiales bacterium]
MNCKIDNDFLQQYLDNTLDRLEKIILDEHIKKCSKCKTELTHLKLLMYELNSIVNDEIEFPTELNSIAENIIENLNTKNGNNEKISIIKTSLIFFKFIPQKNPLTITVQKSFNFMNKLSISTFNFGFKQIRKRFIL